MTWKNRLSELILDKKAGKLQNLSDRLALLKPVPEFRTVAFRKKYYRVLIEHHVCKLDSFLEQQSLPGFLNI